jgi:hypothetical protein
MLRSLQNEMRSGIVRSDLFRCDLVLEHLWSQRIKSGFRCLRLWVHEKSDRSSAGAWQRDIMREVVSHPIHLPRSAQPFADFLHQLVCQRTIPRRFLQSHLTHIRQGRQETTQRFPGTPPHDSAAPWSHLRRNTKALESLFRLGDSDAVHIARRQPCCSRLKPVEGGDELHRVKGWLYEASRISLVRRDGFGRISFSQDGTNIWGRGLSEPLAHVRSDNTRRAPGRFSKKLYTASLPAPRSVPGCEVIHRFSSIATRNASLPRDDCLALWYRIGGKSSNGQR